MEALATPSGLMGLAGRILDADTHEMAPIQCWPEAFGPVTDLLAASFSHHPPNNPGSLNYPGYTADTSPIDPATINVVKGCLAPGSTDAARRLDVMDVTGVARQLVYPSGPGMMGCFLRSETDASVLAELPGDRRAYGLELIKASNEWQSRAAAISDRIRPAVNLYGDDPGEIIANAKRFLSLGLRAFFMVPGVLPGGRSPAHQDLDPLWAMLAEAQVAVTLHTAPGAILKTDAWGQAAAFEGYKVNFEFDLNPWRLSTSHLAAQNFLATMITGQVFERHPTLRFGVIETGAHWAAPLAELLDLWHDNNHNFGLNKTVRLDMRPSEYMARNVRITPFPFEPVDRYIERYGLEDIYCYASDYPHIEGGKNAMQGFYDRLERLGPRVVEKFFVTNAQWLLPD